MDISNWSPVTKVVLGATALVVVYFLIAQLQLQQKRNALIRAKGALPVTYLAQGDTLFGLKLFRQNLAAIKDHKLLEQGMARFVDMGVNTFQLTLLGRRPYFTREPEILKTIQATDHKNWSLGQRRKTGFRPLLGLGIFTTDGADWAHSREMLRPNFVRSQVGDLATFERHVADLIAAIPKDGSTVDLSDLFFLLTMDSATEFLFGESTNALTSGTAEGFADAFNRAQTKIANNARWGFFNVIFSFFSPDKQWENDRKFIHDFVDSFVQRGMSKRNELRAEKSNAEKTGRYVFIDELVRQTDDRIRIRSELLNILLAGRDTTASLLTNVWFTLSKRPDLWQKLQSEVARLNGKAPTFEQIKDMKFMRALLNESLRLYPVVPANSREAVQDTVLPLGGGRDGQSPLFVAKGSVVAWSVYAMHRRKDYYGEDAEEFRPERWLDDPDTGKKGLRPGWEYLPFNGGARICLGQQFALTEASYTTARLCQAFSVIDSRDPEGWIENLSLTCVNLNGAKVALRPRS